MRTLIFFLFAIALRAGAQPIPAAKLSPRLQAAVRTGNDSLWVSVSLTKGAVVPPGFLPVYAADSLRIFRTRLSPLALRRLAAGPEVFFANEALPPQEELNTGAVDYTLNKINLAHQRYPGLRGDSVFVLVKERAFDTTDIDLKGRVRHTGLQSPQTTVHAAVMATVIGGAGNSSPFALGTAPAAVLGSADFANLFPAPATFYAQRNVTVENHSYGTAVENFYGNEAAAHDASAVQNPALLHVFSAGNAGAAAPTSGTYNGLAGAANLTGNFKQSKNTVSVAALDSAGGPLAAASKGPAYDGRLKPELSAYGEDGSSGAAALVSGTAALVQQAFRSAHRRLPPSDLVKALLVNSADEAGVPGPDFATGYGSLNAAKALESVLQNRFWQDSVGQGGLKTFSLTVPPNVAKLKLTLCWRDPAAPPNAGKALVNDLDLRLAGNGATWLPWVLNASPSLAQLRLPAERKVDTLNVTEQITVEAPAAGAYTVEVSGSRLASAAQPFSLVYQFDTTAAFSWTYPAPGDALEAARTQRLRWQTTVGGAAQVEYATASANWRPVASVADLSAGSVTWNLPDTVTTAVLRMRFANGTTVVSDSFVMAPLLRPQTGFDCADSFLLYWNALPASGYRIFALTGDYLQAVRQQPDTALLLRKPQSPSVYYAVAPVVGGREGRRSQTLNYASQGVGCYVKAFFLQSQSAGVAFFTAEIGSLLNVQEVALERLAANGFVAVAIVPSPAALRFSFSDSLPSQGENRYRLRVRLANGVVLYSGVEVVYHLPQRPVVFYPNPAPQQQSLTVLAKEAGRYALLVYDAQGRLVQTQLLNASVNRLLSMRLAKGFYVVRVTDAQGQAFTQKLVVY